MKMTRRLFWFGAGAGVALWGRRRAHQLAQRFTAEAVATNAQRRAQATGSRRPGRASPTAGTRCGAAPPSSPATSPDAAGHPAGAVPPDRPDRRSPAVRPQVAASARHRTNTTRGGRSASVG